MTEKKSFFKRKKKPIIIFSIILFVAILIIFNLQSQREKSLKVTVEKIEKVDLTSKISASGEIKPKKQH
jgi:accessory gene regulator protein AgrB